MNGDIGRSKRLRKQHLENVEIPLGPSSKYGSVWNKPPGRNRIPDRFTPRSMERIMHKARRILLPLGGLASLLFAMGCNQAEGPDSDSPSQIKAAPINDAQVDAAFNKAPEGSVYGKLQFADITEAEARIQKPLLPFGGEPLLEIRPEKLKIIRDTYIRQGQTLKARQLENSYDFVTGLYRGDSQSLDATKALSKAAWWNLAYVSHRGAVAGYWLPSVPNNAWSGSSYDPNQPRFYGYVIQSNIENGVTPSLRFSVGYNNGAGWTSYKSWNDPHSSGNTSVWLQKLRAYTNTANWIVCYDVFQSFNTGGAYTSSGCQDLPAGEHLDGAKVHGIHFELLQ
jgi:hypothetical protein